MDHPEEVKFDLSVAENILNSLNQAGKLPNNKLEEYKDRISKLYEFLTKCMSNDKMLINNAKSLRQQLNRENLNLEQVNSQQKENEETLKQLTEKIEEANNGIFGTEQHYTSLDFKAGQLEHEKYEKGQILKEREDKEKDKIMPELNSLKENIWNLQTEIGNFDKRIEKENINQQHQKKEMEECCVRIEATKEELNLKNEKLNQIRLEPERISKGNAQRQLAINSKDNEIKNLTKQKDGFIQNTEDYDAEIKKLSNQKEKFIQSVTKEKDRIKDLQNTEIKISEEREQIKNETKNYRLMKAERVAEEKALELQKKNLEAADAQKNKKIDTLKGEYKKIEHAYIANTNQVKELEAQLETIVKQISNQKKEQSELNEVGGNLDDENNIFMAQIAKTESGEKQTEDQIKKVKDEISKAEQEVADLKGKEGKLLENIKFLTAIREKMAITSSQANTQARTKKEDLKIIELLILDLTKKHQETEYRLNSFIALYEEVKNARNKYVSMIQNCSQNLAENKERIKILQNELEILRNESSEKDRNLIEAKHQVQREVYKRDSKRAELNKFKSTHESKKAVINQQIKEEEKLNIQLSAIQKDMNELIIKYEQACDSRNYMGIQLIDRNDELCILYEKANIQEGILKNGEEQVKIKEGDVRMHKITHTDLETELKSLRKNVPQVPNLSQQIVTLKIELDHERQKVKELSEKIEDPVEAEKAGRLKYIESDVPDNEFLDAKIKILEERLNTKKEALLEKELVLEEITNLSDQLRKQAMDGRKGTLELAEKINEFRAKTNELSRKMLATVAEVSMLQATVMKLEQEKNSKESMLEEAKKRKDEGLPPKEEDLDAWNKIEMSKKLHLEQSDSLKKRIEIEKSQSYLGVKTTAKPRFTTYKSDVTGLYEHYGGLYAPFYPSELGSNIRHIRKPQPKEIEI